MRNILVGADGKQYPIIGDGINTPFQVEGVDVTNQGDFEVFILAIAEDMPEGVSQLKWDETTMQMRKSPFGTAILHGTSETQQDSTLEWYVTSADDIVRNRPHRRD